MGTSIIAAAMTLLTADNYDFDVKKKDLTAHSRTFRDLEEDFGGVLPAEYRSDMSRGEAELFCAAVASDPKNVVNFCDALTPSRLLRLLALADYYELSHYMPHLPEIFAKKIRREAEHKKIMSGVLPAKASYPVLRLMIARAVIGGHSFLSRSIGSRWADRPVVASSSSGLYRPVRNLRFSHDGSTVFAVCSDSVVRVYDVHAATVRQEIARQYAEQISDGIPVAYGRALVTSSGQILRLWKMGEAGEYADSGALGYHTSDIVGLSAVPTIPHQVVSVTVDGEVVVWDIERKKAILSFSTPSIITTAPTVSCDGQIALGTRNGELIIADMPSGKIIYDKIVYSLGIVPYFDPLGRLLLTTSEGSLKIFDRAKDSLRTGRNFDTPLYSFAPTPDGTFYVLRTGRPAIVVLKAQTFEHVRAIISSRERPLAVWNEHPRALRIVTNYRANLITHDIASQQKMSPAFIAHAESCTQDQLVMLSALDREIERGMPTETFFERAPALYEHYTSLPQVMRDELNQTFTIKGPSIGQRISLAVAALPFFSRL